jgi:deoxyribodipyrimidine photo-lyase
MSTSIYWFRNALRLTDNPALLAACDTSDQVLLIHLTSDEETQATVWGFPRWGVHRRRFRDQAVEGLAAEIARRGGVLHRLEGRADTVIVAAARAVGAARLFCETIAAPEEIAQVAALRAAGLEVRELWQSSLLDPADLPFAIDGLPEVFTSFRQGVERADVQPPAPCAAPEQLSSVTLPSDFGVLSSEEAEAPAGPSSFPFHHPDFAGCETAALAHLARYFGSGLPRSYKATRNGLIGTAYSTKLSPWLGVGAVSARTVFKALKGHEARFGASDGSYWIWFELLWRDYFRFWSLKHGRRLFRARGLGALGPPSHDPRAFARWRAGETGHAFVDAGLRELAATGYLSNRMRQVVASYLIHDLACDWRAGAAWFEACLIDYDVCSNQGNWLYLAGRGADPRGGRRFNPDKQAADYDRDGAYRRLWRGPVTPPGP